MDALRELALLEEEQMHPEATHHRGAAPDARTVAWQRILAMRNITLRKESHIATLPKIAPRDSEGCN